MALDVEVFFFFFFSFSPLLLFAVMVDLVGGW